MRALVVHESLFGNTRRVAETMAEALRAGNDVAVLRTVDVRPGHFEGVELLLLGAPTHGHGLPKPGTRAQTAKKVAAELVRGPGMREVLDMLPRPPGEPGVVAAAFDTRLRWPRWLSGAASRKIAAGLRARGYRLAAAPESFVVRGTEGPLLEGELDRARRWALEVALFAAARHAADARRRPTPVAG